MISSAIAQTLTPVATSNGGVPWLWIIIIGAVLLAAGFVWLKLKKPAVAAQVQTTVSADVAALTAAVQKLVDHAAPPKPVDLSSAVDAAPNPLQAPLDAANGKLAQIKAILEA